MRSFGLIGYPLTHSFSKNYFAEKFKNEGIADCSYELYELKLINAFPDLLNARSELIGLNVTIPYKEAVIPFLNSLDKSAEKVGAVNVIKRESGLLKGYNSDYYGFKVSLQKLLEVKPGSKAAVLGTGGASKAVVAVLKDLGMTTQMVSRTKSDSAITYDDPAINELIEEVQLIVNTTPLGMYPNTETAPEIPYDRITTGCLAYDLVYNPEVSRFLQLAKQNGAIIKNGLEMLELQAEKSWEIWNA